MSNCLHIMTELPVLAKRSNTTTRGNIYIVDSPLVLAIKIGKSTHDARRIARRYATSYGDHFTVYTFASDDIDDHEALVHELQSKYRICMELFKKCSLFESIASCEKICNSKQEIYCHNARTVVRKWKKPDVDEKVNDSCVEPSISYLCEEVVLQELSPIYADDTTKQIYRNLSLVLRCDNWHESVEQMRVRNITWSATSREYSRHYYAMVLLTACGFTDILDKSTLTKQTVETTFKTHEDKIIGMQVDMCKVFDDKRKLQHAAKYGAIMAFINGILRSMYGMHIGALNNKRKHRQSIMIHHNYIGKLFSLGVDQTRPYILLGKK